MKMYHHVRGELLDFVPKVFAFKQGETKNLINRNDIFKLQKSNVPWPLGQNDNNFSLSLMHFRFRPLSKWVLSWRDTDFISTSCCETFWTPERAKKKGKNCLWIIQTQIRFFCRMSKRFKMFLKTTSLARIFSYRFCVRGHQPFIFHLGCAFQ